ncbi:uncharacterized protein LOC131013083 isoform X2 [Salvia miltiorrhiza]|uniref:uncharacterized protein LOC131013083 isoform X2 n=1 Tax=Salvia miltiorrhiza TaxID=226208 RepID=UPI0025AB771D|nr:uncharacterized protein LOC131013083 isoform X2 [Salvia miltiorrhiza]
MAARLSLCSSPMAAPFMGGIRSLRLRVGCLTSSKLVMMCSKNHTHTRSSTKNKIFEDRSAGIVCYRDENGEITCEGYDEGPRFHKKSSRLDHNTRDVEIIELLQRCWLRVAEESHQDKGGN